MCTSPKPVQHMADELGVSRAAMYDWKAVEGGTVHERKNEK